MLFSEPKIPQFGLANVGGSAKVAVSVLFSEPKIPQLSAVMTRWKYASCFSALQRAENSSMLGKSGGYDELNSVSVLFSEPKIPQSIGRIKLPKLNGIVSVLFSEPKIPQLQ